MHVCASHRFPTAAGVTACALSATLLALTACGESRADIAADADASIDGSIDAPRRILVTNDDGIEHPPTLELARALARDDEVYLVAPAGGHSGTSSAMPSLSRGSVTVERHEVGDGITAFAVDGPPGDAVLFALGGPMRDVPPDLVVSGINGGSNLADAWVASGTVGGARAAAWLGVPAVAISGVREDDPQAVEAVVDWSVRLLASPVVRHLQAPDYLTVSLPVVAPDSIRGVEITTRARGLLRVRAGSADPAPGRDGEGVREIDVSLGGGQAPEGSDVAAVREGRIAIVPARAGEDHPELADRLRGRAQELPGWRAAAHPAR